MGKKLTKQYLPTKTSCMLVIAACLWLGGASAEAADEWEWTLIPYFWLADIGVDVAINGEPGLGIDIKATDLIDKVDLVLQAHFEGRRGRGGFFTDLIYMELSDTLVMPDGVSIDADFSQTLFEAGGFYRLKDENSGLDLLYGVRFFEIDQVMDITDGEDRTTVDSSSSFTDGFVGLRYSGSIGEKWSYWLRGDVGAGDTERSLNAKVGFGYDVGKTGRYTMVFGYGYLNLEIEDVEGSTRVESDITLSGPAIGLEIKF